MVYVDDFLFVLYSDGGRDSFVGVSCELFEESGFANCALSKKEYFKFLSFEVGIEGRLHLVSL